MSQIFVFILALACLAPAGCGDQPTVRKPDQPAPLPTAEQRKQASSSSVPARVSAQADR